MESLANVPVKTDQELTRQVSFAMGNTSLADWLAPAGTSFAQVSVGAWGFYTVLIYFYAYCKHEYSG